MTILSSVAPTATAPETQGEDGKPVMTKEHSYSSVEKEKEKEREREMALLTMSESDRLEKLGHLPETFQLFAIVDEVTVSTSKRLF